MMLALAVTATAASATGTRIAPVYKSCSYFDAKYPHGVGRAGAQDHIAAGEPDTTFLRSTSVYNLAMHHNRRLDYDRDGIACENL